MKPFVLLLMVVLLAAHQPKITPANVRLANLQRGTLTFANTDQASTQLYTHTFETTFSSEPSLAAGMPSHM